MKKLPAIILASALLLTGCVGGYDDYKTPDEQAEEIQNQIMESFVNEDKDSLKSLLSDYTLQNNDVDSQIEKAFDYIDSEIISYDKPKTGVTGSSDKKDYGARTTTILTKNGTMYHIGFKGWYSYKDAPEKEGVYCIAVYNESLEKSLSEDQRNDESNYSVIIGAWDK